MFWDVRDLRGHFALMRDDDAPCPHHCCQGQHKHPAGKRVEKASARARRAYLALAAAEERDKAARKAARATRPPDAARRKTTRTREDDRRDLALARHAQILREERQALGYKEETAAFYGSSKVAQAERTEHRITQRAADREAAARSAAEREARAVHRSMTKKERDEYFDYLDASTW